MAKTPLTKRILDLVPWAHVQELLDGLASDGWDRDEALDYVAQMLDEALPLDALIPGPVGLALETIDGPVLRAALGLAWQLATNKQARHARRDKRAHARLSRVMHGLDVARGAQSEGSDG